ncbi:MAG: cation:proton antiporter [Euryarchaeota archaeon]|nr:cation:proton antiporter [Euryarchaeota archaeon]
MAVTDAFFTELAVVLVLAAVALLVVRALRQPLILGYLVAGLMVGPHGPSPYQLVSQGTVETLAQLGIVFIMVSLGVEFHVKKLRSLGAVVIGVSLVQMLASFAAARMLVGHIGLTGTESFLVAAAFSISSTLVVVNVLRERTEMDTPHGNLSVGVLLIQDVAAVAILGLVGGLAVTGDLAFTEAGLTFAGLVVFTLAALILGALVVPRFLHYAARGSDELLLIVLLGLVFGVSWAAVHFGFSVALGAFVVGAIIAETRVVETAQRMVAPLRDMFTAVFFVSVGMLIDPGILVADWRIVLLFAAVVIVSRLLSVALTAFLFGKRMGTGLKAGATLGQVGEFSFIMIAAGVSTGFLDGRWLAIAAGVAGVTILFTPYLIRAADPFIRGTRRLVPAPLMTFAELYTGWVEGLGEAEETERHRARELRLVGQLALNIMALVVVGGIAYIADRAFGESVFLIQGRVFLVSWFLWPIVGLVALPFVLSVWRSLRELAVEIVLELVPDRLIGQEVEPLPVKLVRASLGVVVALLIGFAFFAAMPELGRQAIPVILIAVALVAVMAAFLWRRIATFHSHVEGTIKGLFAEHDGPAQRDEVLRLIGVQYSISLETETVTVAARSPVAHHQIRDAQIRNRTGATIVSLERGEERIINPPPTILLLPGDNVLLMGERHHIDKAKRFITVSAPHPVTPKRPRRSEGPVEVREVRLPQASPMAGKSIVQIGLRAKTGASLVAAIRDHDHIQNPAPSFTLAEGDRLFLIGTPAQLDGAEAFLTSGEPGGAKERGAVYRDEVGRVEGLESGQRAGGSDA